MGHPGWTCDAIISGGAAHEGKTHGSRPRRTGAMSALKRNEQELTGTSGSQDPSSRLSEGDRRSRWWNTSEYLSVTSR